MPTVISSNFTLQIEIEKLIDILQSSGAFIHPDLQVMANDEGISIRLEHYIKDEPLIILNEEHLVDINAFNISVNNGCFSCYKKTNVEVSDLRLSLIESMLTIYNVSKSWDRFENSFPILKNHNTTARKCYELLLSARNPKKNIDSPRQLVKFSEQDLAHLFLRTRTFEYQVNRQEKPKPVLVPLIEFFNHAWDGSVFEQKNQENIFTLKVRARQMRERHMGKVGSKIPVTNECFVFYRPMDALDSYLEYGFVDGNSPVVRSIPLTIEVKNLCCLEIKSQTIAMFGKKLDGNLLGLNKHMPQFHMNRTKKILQVSHIFIPSEHSPFSMRKILLAMVHQLLAEKTEDHNPFEIMLFIEEEIIRENLIFYRDLKQQVDLLQEENTVDYLDSSLVPEIALLCQIIDIQLSKIENYVLLKQKFKS